MSKDRALTVLENFKGRGVVHYLHYVVKNLRADTTSGTLLQDQRPSLVT